MPKKSQQTQLRKGVLELAILTLIGREELYGAALLERLGQYPHLAAPSGTIYPLLSRLTTNNLITSRWEESPKGPPRKYYSLTSEGRLLQAQLQQDFNQIAEDMDRLLEGDTRVHP